MIQRLKEHKFLFMMAVGIALLFFYPYVSNLFLEEQPLEGEDWLLDENAGAAEADGVEEDGGVEVPQTIMADIKGAVVNPGVYVVEESDRVIDLVEKAGGLTKEADTAAVNFAMKVSDEMVVVIPKIGEEPSVLSPGLGSAGLNSDSRVNLNTASASELETLPGIGPSKSAAIIEHRETKGPFQTIDDLKLISGIGEKTFEKLQEAISVK